MNTAVRILDAYRTSGDPRLHQFDWHKGVLERASFWVRKERRPDLALAAGTQCSIA
jgi:hypothetical protein